MTLKPLDLLKSPRNDGIPEQVFQAADSRAVTRIKMAVFRSGGAGDTSRISVAWERERLTA